eukprot:2302308-Amphidinium_carterae.1
MDIQRLLKSTQGICETSQYDQVTRFSYSVFLLSTSHIYNVSFECFCLLKCSMASSAAVQLPIAKISKYCSVEILETITSGYDDRHQEIALYAN